MVWFGLVLGVSCFVSSLPGQSLPNTTSSSIFVIDYL